MILSLFFLWYFLFWSRKWSIYCNNVWPIYLCLGQRSHCYTLCF